MAKIKINKKIEDIQTKRRIKKLKKIKPESSSSKIKTKKYFPKFIYAENSFHRVILYYKNKITELLKTDNNKYLFSIKNELKIINMIYNYIPKITNKISDNKKIQIF